MKKLTIFSNQEFDEPITYVETQVVKEGVECDIYKFSNDDSKDLAIVRVEKGFQTPLQRVLSGTFTTEGYISGTGTLNVKRADGKTDTYKYPAEIQTIVAVNVGDEMQWDADSDLTFYEVCSPPYEDGRFENIA